MNYFISILTGLLTFVAVYFISESIIKYKLKQFPDRNRYDTLSKHAKMGLSIFYSSLAGVSVAFIFYLQSEMIVNYILCLILICISCNAIIDMRIRVLPNVIIFSLAGLVALWSYFVISWQTALLDVMVMVGVTLLVYNIATGIYKREGKYIGTGDIKYISILTVFLFHLGITGVVGFAVGFMLFVCWLIIEVIRKKIGRYTMIPFGPYLGIAMVGAIVAVYIF